MSEQRYSMNSTLGEILENNHAYRFMQEMVPAMLEGPTLNFMKSATLEVLASQASEDKAQLFGAIIAAANGEEIHYNPNAGKTEPPRIVLRGEQTYNIDEVDGQFYMLEHQFSGCLIVSFTKTMDETKYGEITCEGKELPQGLLKAIEMAGGIQMLGIPVRGAFTEYDTTYTLNVEGFVDTDGIMMEPQQIIITTMPKKFPDPVYAEHDEVALQAAREGIVLLKNEENLLPIKPKSKLHIVGGEDFRLGAAGAGRINPRYSIRLLRAIEEYSQLELTAEAELAAIVISRGSGENLDNNPIPGEFYLTSEEEAVIAELTQKFAGVIAIINTGYPIDLRWTETYSIKSVIWCGFPGMLGGKALVEIMDGRVNPSGKLPDTWSHDYYDIPASANFYTTTEGRSVLSTDSPIFTDTVYEEDIYVGYRYFETFDKSVAYPFGHGLSYTSFTIDGALQDMKIKTSVTNRGDFSGKEVIQIYAQIPDGKLEQPDKRLVGFAKTKLLQPGETEQLTIGISKDSLASYDSEKAQWIIEEGLYRFYAGNSIKNGECVGELHMDDELLKQSEPLMKPPVEIKVLSKRNPKFPSGTHSGVKEGVTELTPKSERKSYPITGNIDELVKQMSVEELARLSVCASHGWGMHEKGEAGRIYRLEKYDIPNYCVADGNNGVNIVKPNIGMPCSNTVGATFNPQLAYEIGRVIAGEARENDIHMILAPGMNIHRNPLNGRHPEYFSEDPYLTGIMAGHQSKGLEDNGVSSCLKHTVANNCETGRKRNHSIIPERALREIYLKAFEVAIQVHKPDSIMTGYNAANGVYTAEDEEMIQGIFRQEFGFEGFVMTDWGSYDSIDVAAAVQAGNCWMTPGTTDNTFVKPIVEGVHEGKIDIERLRHNVSTMLRIVQKRTNKVNI